MLSSARPRVAPCTLSVRVHRLAAVLVVAALPFSLSACGLLGGEAKNEAPVVIPSQVEDDGLGASPTGDPSASPDATTSLSPDPAAITTDGADVAPLEATVTRTGVVTQKATTTRTSTATATATATRTLPQVTVTPPAVTVTATATETQTTRVTAPGPGTTVTVSVPCTVPPGRTTC